MAKFYSKTTCGFYDTSVNKTIPDDAVSVSDAAYASLMEAQSSGSLIRPDANGNPVASAVVLTIDQTAVNLKYAAQAALAKSDITVVRCLEKGVAIPGEWSAYRTSLRSIIENPSSSAQLPSIPSYPSGS